MAARKVKTLAVKTGEYIDNVTGQKKGRWQHIGVMLKHDDGNFSLKLESIPVGFDGWISIFDLQDKQANPAQQQQQQGNPPAQPMTPQQASVAAQAPAEFDDDIPF